VIVPQGAGADTDHVEPRKLRKHALVASALVAASAVGAAAHAAAGWRVVATATDSGQVMALTSTRGSVYEPRNVAVRATGTGGRTKVTWFLSCHGGAQVKPGTTIVVDVAAASTCTLNAGGQTESGGSIKLQILGR
jgi:hypothetical protein